MEFYFYLILFGIAAIAFVLGVTVGSWLGETYQKEVEYPFVRDVAAEFLAPDEEDEFEDNNATRFDRIHSYCQTHLDDNDRKRYYGR